jgi:hypothetical protein
MGGMDGNPPPRLGVDIGRVIIAGPEAVAAADSEAADTAFFGESEEEAMATPAVAGAFEALARLSGWFGGRVWIVSKCGERTEARSLRWLEHNGFHDRTAIPPDHVRFCRQRAQKAVHATELGLTHFVDDRLDVHAALEGIVAHRYLFGPGPAPAGIEITPTWAAVEAAIARR